MNDESDAMFAEVTKTMLVGTHSIGLSDADRAVLLRAGGGVMRAVVLAIDDDDDGAVVALTADAFSAHCLASVLRAAPGLIRGIYWVPAAPLIASLMQQASPVSGTAQ